MEINFTLDGDGRIRCDANESLCYETTTQEFFVPLLLRATTSTTEESSSWASVEDALLLDAEIADCALMPRTFWVFASSDDTTTTRTETTTTTTIRCLLEQMAMQVFHHHTRHLPKGSFDANKSGAEWWVQIRPSPEPMGRYAVLESSSKANGKESPVAQKDDGICFHWDKDEDLRLLAGGNLYVHPQLSTVTYLTTTPPSAAAAAAEKEDNSSCFAPTIVVENGRIHPLNGQWMMMEQPHSSSSSFSSCVVSWPRKGKHLSFDGRFLHGAPTEVIVIPSTTKNKKTPSTTLTSAAPTNDNTMDSSLTLITKNKTNKTEQVRKQRRVTFLVNIWLNHKPFNVEPFPETMLDKLTKPIDDYIMFPKPNNTPSRTDQHHDTTKHSSAAAAMLQLHIGGGSQTGVLGQCHASEPSTTRMTWQLGGGGGATTTESDDDKLLLEMDLPLQDLQQLRVSGGTAHVTWKNQTGLRVTTPAGSAPNANTNENDTTSADEKDNHNKRRRKDKDCE